MSEIALYNALTKIPGITDDEAKEAVADVAKSKDVATKSDLLKLEIRLVKQMYMVAGVIILVNMAAVGLMIRFLI